ncbi:hypothetical protein HHI36_022749 [Cryptolaemus montrouzieri]|uniref:Uncharacterized protein n=1 Tax=Cryptolaemus montrouzieri TaxID=559131 RepID=A0ABD2N0H1_9CUCU
MQRQKYASHVIAKEATAPSALTAAPLTVPEAYGARVAGIGKILEIPKPPKKPNTSRKKRDCRAKCLNEIETEHQPSTFGAISYRQMETSEDDDDWVFGKCRKNYSEDKEEKWSRVVAMVPPGWPTTLKCQQEDSKEEVFMCDICAEK